MQVSDSHGFLKPSKQLVRGSYEGFWETQDKPGHNQTSAASTCVNASLACEVCPECLQALSVHLMAIAQSQYFPAAALLAQPCL
jgi:hypothetical protein